MVSLLSLPLFITSSLSLLLAAFFTLLYVRITRFHQEAVKNYIIFAISALSNSVFFGAFAIFLNSAEFPIVLNITNRITVISAMFSFLLSLHFYLAFFNYRAPIFLRWSYCICVVFSFFALFPNAYFLGSALFSTSKYYTGLVYGPLFELWGGWVLILSGYSVFVIIKVFQRQRQRGKVGSGTVLLLLIANIVWLITGVLDMLTGLQFIDIPPLTWAGSFFVICCIAWLLIKDIDGLYEAKRSLNTQLMFDHVTNACSRSYLDVRMTESFNLLFRGQLSSVAVCVFDIDHFKEVNDTYGHETGDSVLAGITKVVQGVIRTSDCIARLGGDEFVILINNHDAHNDVPKLIERIRAQILDTEYEVKGRKFQVSCSFGVAEVLPTFDDTGIDDVPSFILAKADDALYHVKRNGRNNIACVSVLSANSCNDIELLSSF